MRRIVILCVAISILALALSGCGGTKPTAGASTKPNTANTNTKKVNYPLPINFAGPVNDGITTIPGTKVKLVAEISSGKAWKMQNLRVKTADKMQNLNDTTDPLGNDTQVRWIGKRYLVHIDGLTDQNKEFYGTAWDFGPQGIPAGKIKTLKIPFGVDYQIPGTQLVMDSELYGRWVYYELFAAVRSQSDRYVELNTVTSVPEADSPFRLVDDRYLLHVEGLSKTPKKYFTLMFIDLGDRFKHEYVTLEETVPTRIKTFDSEAVVTYRRVEDPAGSSFYRPVLELKLPGQKPVRIGRDEVGTLDTCTVRIESTDLGEATIDLRRL